jgi:transposase
MPPSGSMVWRERIECHPLGCAGSLGPGACAKEPGGDRRSRRIEAEAAFILGAVAELPDMTLAELKGKLGERGMSVGIATLWRFFQRHRITLKKRVRMPLSKSAQM